MKTQSIRLSIGITIFVVLMLCVSIAFATNAASIQKEAAVQKLQSMGILEGELELIEQRKDINGALQYEYQDQKYTYIIAADSGDMVFAKMNSDKLDNLVIKASSIEAVALGEAQQLAQKTLSSAFPSYQLKDISLEAFTGNGNPIDYVIYTIEEKHDDIIVNRAVVSIGIDGSVTSFGGTNNSLSDFDDSGKFTQEQIQSIIYDYFAQNKSGFEKSMQPTLESTFDIKLDQEKDVLIDADEWILPDGINSIEEYKAEKLPDYKLYLNSIKDMKFDKIYREKYNDTIVWCASFSLRSNWGDAESILNPYIVARVDAKTGQIVDIISTDSN